MWTGVTYAVAAFLLQHGRDQEAFQTARGCYEACFERSGLQFQTPEAMYETRCVFFTFLFQSIFLIRMLLSILVPL